jgi:hypothetical protein
MDKIAALLSEVAHLLPVDWRLEAVSSGVNLTMPNGRHQLVRIDLRGDRYVLSSVALGQQRVSQKPTDRIALITWLWKMNRELGVVGLMLDRAGRLVGRIEQVAETLDAAELALYMQLLARECDRLEYVLSGQDYA